MGAHGVRPSGSLRINWDSPLADGLRHAFGLGDGFPAFDAVTGLLSGASTPISGPVTRALTQGGIGREFTSTNDYIDVGDSRLFLPTTGITIVVWKRKTDATNRISLLFAVDDLNSAPTVRCGTHCPYSDGTVYWDFGGVTSGTTRLSVAGLTFGDDVWVFTTGARGMEVWQNGLLKASNAANPTRAASAANFHIGNAPTLGNGADLVVVHDLYIYDRQLPSATCAMFADPQWRWDLYRVPTRRKFWFPKPVTTRTIPVIGAFDVL